MHATFQTGHLAYHSHSSPTHMSHLILIIFNPAQNAGLMVQMTKLETGKANFVWFLHVFYKPWKK